MPHTTHETESSTATITPFSSNSDFLTIACAWLRARALRLATKRNFDDQIKSGIDPNARTVGRPPKVARISAREKLDDATEAEKLAETTFKTRCEEHRTSPNCFTLGIDKLASDAGLTEAEQLVLLICTIPSISTRLGEDVLGAGSYFGGPCTVDQLSAMVLDSPDDIEALLTARKMFVPGGALLRHNLITVEFSGRHFNPEDLPMAYVRLTGKALASITGHPELADECISDGTENPQK